MVKIEELFMIRDMKNKGMSIKQIAEELDLDRKTVSKWLKAENLPTYRRAEKSTGKLDQ